jgi:hypothetical protein
MPVIPKFRMYWSAFEATRLYGVVVPYRMRLLMKLAFLSGIVAAITFSRLVRNEFPQEDWARMIADFEGEVQQQIHNTEWAEQRRSGWPEQAVGLRKILRERSAPVDKKKRFSIGKDGKVVDLRRSSSEADQ